MNLKLAKILGGTAAGVVVAATVAGSVAGCLVKNHTKPVKSDLDSTSVAAEVYKLSPVLNVGKSITFSQFNSMSAAQQQNVIVSAVIAADNGKMAPNGEVLRDPQLETLSLTGRATPATDGQSFTFSFNSAPTLRFTITGFGSNSSEQNNSQAIHLLPQFKSLSNKWESVSSINTKAAPMTTLNTSDSYFNYQKGVKTALPLSTPSALALPTVASQFAHWIGGTGFTQTFQNDVLSYVATTIQDNYNNWGQTNNIDLENGVFVNNTAATLSVHGNGAIIKSFVVNIQVANTDQSAPQKFSIFGQSYVVAPQSTLGLTINFAGAQLAPTLVPYTNATHTPNLNTLTYTLRGFTVANVSTTKGITVTTPFVVNANPPSLNTVVANSSAALGDDGIAPLVAKNYLANLTGSDVTNTVAAYANSIYKMVTNVGTSAANILSAFVENTTLGGFLTSIGKPIATMLQNFGIPTVYTQLIADFFSDNTVGSFFANPNNETILEDLVGNLTNSSLALSGIKTVWGSFQNEFRDSSNPKPDTTITQYDPNETVVNNLENLLGQLPEYADTTLVQFLGDNLNFFFNVVINGIKDASVGLSSTEIAKIQSILHDVELIVNTIQAKTIVVDTTKNDVTPTEDIMNINYLKVLSSTQMLNSFLTFVENQFGSFFSPAVNEAINFLNELYSYDGSLANIAPSAMMAFYGSFLYFQTANLAAYGGTPTNESNPIPLAQLFSPKYLAFTAAPKGQLPLGYTPLTYEKGILNGTYVYSITLQSNIVFNLKPLQHLLNNITVGEVAKTIRNDKTLMEQIDAKVGGYKDLVNAGLGTAEVFGWDTLGTYIPSYLMFEAGEGVVNTITFHNTTLGIQDNLATGKMTWTAPMTTTVYPEFFTTVNEFLSLAQSWSFIWAKIIDDVVAPPLYFYMHYGYTNNYVFNSLLVPYTGTLDNAWTIPGDINYNHDVIVDGNSVALKSGYLTQTVATPTAGSSSQTGTTAEQTVVSEIINYINNTKGVVVTNPHTTTYAGREQNTAEAQSTAAAESQIGTYNIENVDTTQIQNKLWAMISQLLTIGDHMAEQPVILVNILPSFDFSAGVKQADANLRQFSIQLYFATPVIVENSTGVSQVTNWLSFDI